MKYGKQLTLAIYAPWRDRYFQYNKLKRMINRMQQEKDKEERVLKEQRAKASDGGQTSGGALPSVASVSNLLKDATQGFSTPPRPQVAEESQPLTGQNRGSVAAGYGVADGYGEEDPEALEDARRADEARRARFMEAVCANVDHVNAFFIGKEAELHGLVLELERASSHPYMMEFRGDINHYKKVYQEIIMLQRYVTLNREAARKIVKKFDKLFETEESGQFKAHLDAQPFATSSGPEQLVKRMQALISRDKLLKLQQQINDADAHADDAIFPHVRRTPLLISVALFFIMFASRLLHHNRAAHRCLALVVFTISMWSTEAIPYFATALLVPILVVVLGILEDPLVGLPLPAEEAAQVVLNGLVNHTSILILGGYAVSAAFSRCELELQISAFLQRRLGKRPRLFMLALMYMGLFLSAVISNHTSPVLMLSIVTPILRDFDPESQFTKTMLLGLAFACNFGGMMTPISSMQDALAVSYLQAAHVDVSFGRWICMAFPMCMLLVFLCWLYLTALYRPDDVAEIPPILCSKDSLSRKDVVVVLLSLLTMVLWSTLEFTKDVLGDLGIVSLIFVVIIFGSGMLTQIDFNSFNWHTLMLLGGGSVLGKAISSSHLLEIMVHSLFESLPLDNIALLMSCTLLATLVISTFVSHTVAALILMPVIVQLGKTVGDPSGLAITAALAVSAAMALPFSSFPNVIILSCVDDFERPYLVVSDFLLAGLPMSLIALVIVGTVGYSLIQIFMG